jgi:hypothetical protein
MWKWKIMRKITVSPEEAIQVFRSGLRRALKVTPEQFRVRVEADKWEREMQGHKKRGPKPKKA